MAGKTLDQEIKELLDQAAAHSDRYQTVWMDLEAITWIVMDSFSPGARKQVRNRLVKMKQLGQVESRNFGGVSGWRKLKKGR